MAPEVAKRWKMWIFAFFWKKALYWKIFKIMLLCSERIYRDTDRRVVFKFRDIWLTEISKVKSCVRCALEGKSNIWLKPSFEPKKQWFSVYRLCRERLLRGAFDWFLTIMSLPLRFRCSCTQTSLHVQDVTFDSSFKKCIQLLKSFSRWSAYTLTSSYSK